LLWLAGEEALAAARQSRGDSPLLILPAAGERKVAWGPQADLKPVAQRNLRRASDCGMC